MFSCFEALTSLNTKNLKEIKLKGAIIAIGINFAIFGSIPTEVKVLSIKVPRLQKVIRLTRYFRLVRV